MEFGGTLPPEDLVLPSDYMKIHLRELKHSTRRKIALYLNLEVVLNDEIGLEPNYRGLAELVQFDTLEIRNFELPSVKSPTDELLDQWTMRDDLVPTVGNLWNYILELGRVDVLTDVWPFIERDCNKYLERQKLFKTKPSDNTHKPVQVHTVSQSSVSQSVPVTVHDVLEPGGPKMYDAFVCYNPEGEDLKFVQLMIRVLEDENNLRLFVPWRDDLSGTSHDTICAKLIEKRCKRMIIVMSPRFLESVSCDFQVKFAHSLSPGARTRKLVPIIFERCTVPEILHPLTCCDYTRLNVREWFWRRLVCSLTCNLDLGPQMTIYDDPKQLDKLSFDTSMEVSWSESSTASANSSSLSVMNSGQSTSVNNSDSSMSYSSSDSSSISPSASCQSSANEPSSNPDYERIGNLSTSKSSRFRNFFRSPKKRPVPPIPDQR